MARRPLVAFCLVLALVAACAGGEGLPQTDDGVGLGGFPAEAGGSGGRSIGCDADGDGHDDVSCGGDDCNDGDPAIHPGAEESCDAIDADCDGDRLDGCGCVPGDAEPCWTGEDGNRNVGACRDGVRTCSSAGTWSECGGQVLPAAETCDGIDEDCDREPDPHGCPVCPPGAVELCGNGLDDDCNGKIDDADLCTVDCSQVNPRTPADPAMACCAGSPPTPFDGKCSNVPGLLPACPSDERACLDLDGDAATVCTKVCGADGCFCGRDAGTGKVTLVPDCGFLTACSRISCGGRRDQPCYSGPPATLGNGVCHGGHHSCIDGAWDSCAGEQLPGVELCANGVDDDCDGRVDEVDGATGKACASLPTCAPDAPEICDNGLDDDCDGFADEACPAPAGATQACWTGTLLDRRVGTCRDGTQQEHDGIWTLCEGEVLPAPEACGDGIDSDCDGLGGAGEEEDVGCCIPRAEVCDGVDNDCDGLADEGLLSRCGTCGPSAACLLASEPAELSDCNAEGRSCERIAPVDLNPSSITLNREAPLPEGSDMIAFTDGGSSLVQMDTRTTFTRRASLPFAAARVLMGPDGTLWVAGADAGVGQILHLDAFGNMLCKAETGAGTMTVDSDGDLWVIVTGTLARYSGHLTTKGGDGAPRCAHSDADNLAVTGTCAPAEDANHILWVVGSAIERIDLRASDPEVERFTLNQAVNFNQTMIGSEGALYGNEFFLRVELPPARDAGSVRTYLDPWVFIPMYDGTAWVWIWPNTDPESLAQLDLATGEELRRIFIPDRGTNSAGYGLALDALGSLWTKHGNELERFRLATAEWDRFLYDGAVMMWPTSTDRPLRELARRRARWTQVFDPGGYDVIWRQLSWQATIPERSRVLVQVRFADDPADMDDSDRVCGPFETSPVQIGAGCSGGRRYARVEVELSGYAAPTVDRVRLTWDRK